METEIATNEVALIPPDYMAAARSQIPAERLAEAEAEATALVVTDTESRDLACRGLAQAAAWVRTMEKFWEPIKTGLFSRYRAVRSAETDGLDGISPGTERLAALRKRYEEALRVWDKKVAEDNARRQAAVTQAATSNREQMLAQAAELMEQGEVAEARRLRENIDLLTSPVLIPHDVPLANGVSARKPLKGTVTDTMALIRAIAAGEVPLEYELPVRGGKGQVEKRPLLVIDPAVLNAKVRELGESLNWAGVEVREEQSYVAPRNR